MSELRKALVEQLAAVREGHGATDAAYRDFCDAPIEEKAIESLGLYLDTLRDQTDRTSRLLGVLKAMRP